MALAVFSLARPGQAEITSSFDAETQTWTYSNGLIDARFELNPAGLFRFVDLRTRAGAEWRPAFPGNSSPIRFQLGQQDRWDEQRAFRLVGHELRRPGSDSARLAIVLEDLRRTGQVTLEFDLYENHPVLRYGVRYRNLTESPVYVSEASPVAWELSDGGERYQAMRVEQWMPVADPADFDAIVTPLSEDASPVTLDTGAHGRYCTWLALADRQGRGLAWGWEFDGRATVSVAQRAEWARLSLQSQIPDLHHAVAPDAEFQVPRAFVAAFQGDWDAAAHATQRFVERALAKPAPTARHGAAEFPYAAWDSWGYGADINEATLRRNAEAAARLGIELFVVDLGWARMLGDWREDPAKFPAGLRALSDYVHSLGMQFGLHFAFGEAMAEAPVFQTRSHQDWTSSVNYGYYGARSLCLAHDPVRRWIVDQAVRLIDDYNVDWILQDGENMVRECRKDTHTHHPDDSNYAGAVDGLGWILREVQSRRPHVAWENCENGGNLMTFQMVQNYVTSIVNDASGARGARKATHGATFPFPARYADRYMPEQRMLPYTTRSYLFGGPWIFMNDLTAFSREDFEFTSAEVTRFKEMRGVVTAGKILHLTEPAAAGRTDAMAAWDAAADSGVAVVTRDNTAYGDTFWLRIPEADPARSYRIRFADERGTLTYSGQQLRTQGVPVKLPWEWYSEVVYVDGLK
ncbi:MAG: alpha-galactosidase [Bryobacterales bacterium]|nr:alpha-galactosidase [Bryobacterales bacterium]